MTRLFLIAVLALSFLVPMGAASADPGQSVTRVGHCKVSKNYTAHFRVLQVQDSSSRSRIQAVETHLYYKGRMRGVPQGVKGQTGTTIYRAKDGVRLDSGRARWERALHGRVMSGMYRPYLNARTANRFYIEVYASVKPAGGFQRTCSVEFRLPSTW